MRSARVVLAVALLTLGAAWTGAIAAPAAAAGSTAVVVIDTGAGSPQSSTVNVGGGTSGMQALNAVASVVTGFDGAAVCKINGVGNDPGRCLVGPRGEYWSYWRASEGSTDWSYSSSGATVAPVHGGDVEGWRYGFGTPPRGLPCDYAPPCPPPPTDPPPPTPTAAPAPVPTAAPVTPGVGATPSATTAPTGGKNKATDSASDADDGSGSAGSRDDGDKTKNDGEKTEDKAARTTKHDGDRETALGSTDGDDGGSGSPVGVLIVVGVLVAVAASVVIQQRRRHKAG